LFLKSSSLNLFLNFTEIRQSTPLIRENKITKIKEAANDPNDPKNGYARKRSILRKLMIAQRQKFNLKKEILDGKRIKKQLADTSLSNVSDLSGDDEKSKNMKYFQHFF
jgi:hypothetical protein